MCLLFSFIKAMIMRIESEVNIMAIIYVQLIIKGRRTYMSVPKVIRPQVRDLLIELDLDNLLPEKERPPKADPDKAEADS